MASNQSNLTLNVNRMRVGTDHVVLIVMALLIVLFNAAVLFIMAKNKSLRNAQNGLLASLAVSDMSSGLLGIPLSFTCTFVSAHLCAFCYVSYYFFKFISISTVLHILAIIAERCFLVVDPFLHRRFRSIAVRSNLLIIGGIWVTSLIASVIPWIWMSRSVENCAGEDDWHTKAWNPQSVYELTCFLLFFVVPLIFISFFLTKIFVAVHQFSRRKSMRCSEDSQKRLRLIKNETRIFIVLLCVFLLFVVCWLPYFMSTLLHFINVELPEWLYEATPFFRSLTSLLNPLVYAFYKDDFYQAMKRRLKSINCRSKARDAETVCTAASRNKAQIPLVEMV